MFSLFTLWIYLIPEGDHEVDDDAVGPAEASLDVVLATSTGAAAWVDVVLKKDRIQFKDPIL